MNVVPVVIVPLLALLAGCSRPSSDVTLYAAAAPHLLVVVNSTSPDSVQLGKYYATKRHIPNSSIVLLSADTAEETSMASYHSDIEGPVKDALRAHPGTDYIVMTKGVPIRIQEGGYSVDAFLASMELSAPVTTALDDKAIASRRNPYFGKNQTFHHADFGMYLVTRLDGYTYDDARALVDRSLAAKPEKTGFFFDEAANRKGGGYVELETSMERATEILKTKGFNAAIDKTAAFVAPDYPLAGYAGWGSNDGAFNLDTYHKLKFKPGALCETFVSTSARTFNHTTGGQSLIADLIAQGVTGVKGYVSEPYTFALARPDILFDRYTGGFNLAESFYMASPVIKWKDVVIGDPLCSPYAGHG